MANAVLQVLNHLKVKKAKFIGHSMGGYVALALAEKEPKLFTGLCLMNSTFEADGKERKILRTRAIKIAHTNYKNLIRMSFANLFAPKSKEFVNGILDTLSEYLVSEGQIKKSGRGLLDNQ